MTTTVTEQLIQCRKIFAELDVVLEEVLEGEPTPDQIANMLIGIKQLQECRIAKLERLIQQQR
jgi:hypothetical protein